ncbi:pentapeptide repeat-containing protein [Streptomyces sp. NPDC055287]
MLRRDRASYGTWAPRRKRIAPRSGGRRSSLGADLVHRLPLVGAQRGEPVARDARSADLTYANLTNANLTDVDLTGADLTGADLRGTDPARRALERCVSGGCDVVGADAVL